MGCPKVQLAEYLSGMKNLMFATALARLKEDEIPAKCAESPLLSDWTMFIWPTGLVTAVATVMTAATNAVQRNTGQRSALPGNGVDVTLSRQLV